MPGRLRRLRRERGLTQEQLAGRLGVAFTTVNAWENGRRRPTGGSLDRIAKLEAEADSPPVGDVAPAPAGTVLPADQTSFLGREEDLARLQALWSGGARWLTVSGPGGVGKTRVATELLRRVRTDVLATVPLDGVNGADLVVARIADAVGVELRPGSGIAALVAALADRSGVIMLDTCEHLAATVAALAAQALPAAPGIRFLATSQAVLAVPGEQVYRLAPLELGPDGPAVQFFRARVRDHDSRFTAEGPEAAAVIEVCRRVDGLPMTLELVAAWMPVLRPSQLLERWDQVASTTSGTGTAGPDRHLSSAASVEWSAALLTEAEQALVARLSIFAGPFTLAEVDALAASDRPDALVLVRRLVDLSWLQARPDPVPHFRMLQSLREWGRAHLNRSAPETVEALRRAHAEHQLAVCRQAEAARFNAEGGWVDRLRLLRGDLDAGMAWALSADVASGVALATCLLGWWRRSGGLVDGWHWLSSALSGELTPLDRARAQTAAALIAMDTGSYDDTERLSTAALAVLTAGSDPVWRARALTAASSAAKYHGDARLARCRLEEAIAALVPAGDRHDLAAVYNNLGALAAEQDDLEDAAEFYRESLAIKELLGDDRATAIGLANVGDLYSRSGRLAESAEVLDAGLAISRRIGDGFLSTFILINVAENLLRMHEPQAARTTFDEAYGAAVQLRIPRFQALAAAGAAQALLDLGQRQAALRQLRTGRTVAERIGDDIVLRQIRITFARATGTTAEVIPPRGLTARELQVLQYLVDGESTKEIARRLAIEPATVKTHLTSLYAKLGARNRTEAATIAVGEGVRPTNRR